MRYQARARGLHAFRDSHGKITTLREALSISRPFVMHAISNKGEFGNRAKKTVAVVDHALVTTDPDPIVREILNRQA